MRRERSKGGSESKGGQLDLLDAAFRSIRRQASKWRGALPENTEAWESWSASIDAGLELVGRISAAPADNIEEVAIKLSALLWAIEINESLLDVGDLRRMRALNREVRRLARAAGR